MNGRTAKMIRSLVYGDLSIREKRKYEWNNKQKNWGTIKAVGKRAEYQTAKQIYYKKRRKAI